MTAERSSPSIGRIVRFKMSAGDARMVNRRRVYGALPEEYGALPEDWPAGAQAHIGNEVHAGDVFPAMIVRLWVVTFSPNPPVQLQVFLDGNDTYWAAGRYLGDGEGEWAWPVVVQ